MKYQDVPVKIATAVDPTSDAGLQVVVLAIPIPAGAIVT